MSSADTQEPRAANDFFWLARAATVIEESAERLDQGAQRIAAAMAWFWTAYSGIVTVVLAISDQRISVGLAVFAACPALALFLAYGVASWASLPVPINFNPVIPAQIKAAHEAAIDQKRRRVRASVALGSVAAIMVALVGMTFATRSGAPDRSISITLLHSVSPPEVLVRGTVPEDAQVVVRVTPTGAPAVAQVIDAAKDRAFTITMPVTSAAAYDVEVSWRVGTRTTVLREAVSP